MSIRIGINGFGRIGRAVVRILSTRPDEFQITAINDIADASVLANLLKRDTTFGAFPGKVAAIASGLQINGQTIRVTNEKDPEKIPWRSGEVDIVLESTGRFRSREAMEKHLHAGAKKVLLSAPAKGHSNIDATIIMGVNDATLESTMKLISNASCTSNCVVPMAKVLHDQFGIESGFMTTAHAYTSSQALLDTTNKDPRRARAATENIVPTTTGAADMIGHIIPELSGKITGLALRVPVPCGSIVDFTVVVKKPTTREDVNACFLKAAQESMKNVLEYTEEPLVSSDIIGNANSCVFDATWTRVINGNLVKVLGWYDNEWAYSSRIVDLLKIMGGKL